MNSGSTENNPYAANYPQHPGIAGDDSGELLRPSGLTAVGILYIVFGCLALFACAGTAFQVLVGTQISAAMAPSGEKGDAQREAMSAVQEVNNQFLIPQGINCVAVCILGACMIAGGYGVFPPKNWAQGVLRKTAMFAMVYEIYRSVLNGIVQYKMMPLMEMQMRATTQGTQGFDPSVFIQMQQVMMIVGIVFAVGWMLVKLGFYAWTLTYLNKDHVTTYLNTSKPPVSSDSPGQPIGNE